MKKKSGTADAEKTENRNKKIKMDIIIGTLLLLYFIGVLFFNVLLEKNQGDEKIKSGVINLIALTWILWIVPFFISDIKSKRNKRKMFGKCNHCSADLSSVGKRLCEDELGFKIPVNVYNCENCKIFYIECPNCEGEEIPNETCLNCNGTGKIQIEKSSLFELKR